MYRYDADTGDYPKLGDRVKPVRSGIDADGITGVVGGWLDSDCVTALVSLETPMPDGRTIVAWPVVCLIKTVSKEFEQTWAPFIEKDWHPTKNPIGNLCSESVAIDSDGYTIWEGDADRPVSDDTLIQVKLRDGTIREIRDAGFWYQCHWQHFKESEDMKKWDIVAYKVVK